MNSKLKFALLSITLIFTGFVILIFSIGAIAVYATEATFTVPGDNKIELKSAGSYELFYDFTTSFEGVKYKTPHKLPDGAQVKITDQSNNPIALQYNTEEQTAEDPVSVLIGYFKIEKPASITVKVSGLDDTRVFSIYKSVGTLVYIALGISIFLIAAGVFIPLHALYKLFGVIIT